MEYYQKSHSLCFTLSGSRRCNPRICSYGIFWSIYHQTKSIRRSFGGNYLNPYVRQRYERDPNRPGIDCKMNTIGYVISVYDGSRRAIFARIPDTQKSNEDEIASDLFWSSGLGDYDTMIFL